MEGSLVVNYRIIRRLGQGGMGDVFEARHEHIKGQRRAIKFLRAEFAGDQVQVDRLFREAQILHDLNHPGIVKVENCGRLEDGRPYLVMELLHGDTLRQRLDQGALPPGQVRLVQLVADAMAAAAAHGIIHRDLKPENVFIVTDDGGNERVKVLDFGLARLANEHRRSKPPGQHDTSAGGVFGTPAYMAPEQWSDPANVDGKADVYSLGIILYQALSGQLPFQGLGYHALMFQHCYEPPPPLGGPLATDALRQLCLEMLDKNPMQRPSMAEVAQRLTIKPRLDCAGPYRLRLDPPLGAGGMGTVYLATHRVTNQQVAVKVLTALEAFPSADQAIHRDRFLNEARAAVAAKHPGIVTIFDCGYLEDGTTPYIAMELCQDGSLRDLLKRTKEPPPLELFRQIASALCAAHAAGIVHRDLKPENVFLTRDGNGQVITKVADFGIAKLAEDRFGSAAQRVKTKEGRIFGTPAYMSPEQCRDTSRVDAQADVYALGVMLYEAYTGALPFSGNFARVMHQHMMERPRSITDIVPTIPSNLASLIERMLEKEPVRRPTMPEVAQVLGCQLPVNGPSESIFDEALASKETFLEGVASPALPTIPVVSAPEQGTLLALPDPATIPVSGNLANATTVQPSRSEHFPRAALIFAGAMVIAGFLTYLVIPTLLVAPRTANDLEIEIPSPLDLKIPPLPRLVAPVEIRSKRRDANRKLFDMVGVSVKGWDGDGKPFECVTPCQTTIEADQKEVVVTVQKDFFETQNEVKYQVGPGRTVTVVLEEDSP